MITRVPLVWISNVDEMNNQNNVVFFEYFKVDKRYKLITISMKLNDIPILLFS